MQSLRLLPAVVAALVLGAHLSRAGLPLAAAAAVAALPLVLLLRHALAVRALEIVLALGALEWLRTLARLVAERRAHGLPYARLAWILAAVAALTALAVPLVERWWRGSRARRLVEAA